EPLGLINLQAAILAPPLVVGLFRDPRTPADLPRSLALRDPHLGFTQEADDLLSRLPLPCHLHISSRDFGNSRIRSSHLVPHQGSRPLPFAVQELRSAPGCVPPPPRTVVCSR